MFNLANASTNFHGQRDYSARMDRAPSNEYSECEQKQRLLHKYETAVSEYSRSVSVLKNRLGVLEREEYVRIQRFTEEARVRAEEARIALEKHVQQHGC